MPMNEEKTQASEPGPPSTDVAAGLPPMPSQAEQNEWMPDVPAGEPTFMEVFLAWEKLRLLYNGILLVISLSNVLQSGFTKGAGILLMICALLANVCFCVGPVAEGYLCWTGLPHKTSRSVVFQLGTCIVLVTLLAYLPGWLRKAH